MKTHTAHVALTRTDASAHGLPSFPFLAVTPLNGTGTAGVLRTLLPWLSKPPFVLVRGMKWYEELNDILHISMCACSISPIGPEHVPTVFASQAPAVPGGTEEAQETRRPQPSWAGPGKETPCPSRGLLVTASSSVTRERLRTIGPTAWPCLSVSADESRWRECIVLLAARRKLSCSGSGSRFSETRRRSLSRRGTRFVLSGNEPTFSSGSAADRTAVHSLGTTHLHAPGHAHRRQGAAGQ